MSTERELQAVRIEVERCRRDLARYGTPRRVDFWLKRFERYAGNLRQIADEADAQVRALRAEQIRRGR